MKDQNVFDFDTIAPMLATHGSVSALKASQWAFEGKWDGYRLLVEVDHGTLRVRSRRGREVTGEYRELRSLAKALEEHHAVLDGEAVVLDKRGVPNFHEMQNRGKERAGRILGVRPALPRRPLAAAGPLPRSAKTVGNAGLRR